MLNLKHIRFVLKTKYLRFYNFQQKYRDIKRRESQLRKLLKHDSRFKNVNRDKKYLKEAKDFLTSNFDGYKNTDWHFYFSHLNKSFKPEYIPSSIFFPYIEPTLNKVELAPAYVDKTSYDNLFSKSDMPETVFKMFNGKFFDANNDFIENETAYNQLALMNESLIIKPAIHSGGGRNVVLTEAKKLASMLKSNSFYSKGSFIIQKKIVQHELMAKLNPNSVNTCRIMTARIKSDIVVLSAYVRIGRKNSKIDNAQSGGIFCKINNDESIEDKAIDKAYYYYDKHPDSGLKFSGFKIPNYGKAVEFCLKNHKRFLRFTFISWDIAIRNDGAPVFIELNLSHQAINGHQVVNGPLFGKHTYAIIKKFQEEKKNDFLTI